MIMSNSMEQWNLPTNWEWIPLEHIISELESGSRPKGGVRLIFEGVPSIGGEHLTNFGEFDFSKVKYIPFDYANKMKRGKIKYGDILIVKDGATTGKTSYVDRDFPYELAYINEHVFRLQGNPEKINQEFLFYFLLSKYGKELILSSYRGAAQGGINQNFVKLVFVPLPPLEEQVRLVGRVKQILSELRQARIIINRVEKDKELLVATLQDFFDLIAIDKSLFKPIKDIGVAFNGRASGEGVSNIRVFKTKHVYPFNLKLTDPSFLQSDQIKNFPKERFLLNGDVLVCNIAKGTLGRTCFIENAESNWTVDTSIMIVRANPEICLPKYIFYYLYSRRGQAEIQKRERGIAFADKRGQTHLYPRDMLTIPVPVIPIPDQIQAIRIFDQVKMEEDELTKKANRIAQLLETTINSTFSLLFKGEL